MDRGSPGVEGVLAAKPNGRQDRNQHPSNKRPLVRSSRAPKSGEDSITSDNDARASRGAAAATQAKTSRLKKIQRAENRTAQRPEPLTTRLALGRRPSISNSSITSTPSLADSSRESRIPRPKSTAPTATNIPTSPSLHSQSSEYSSPMRRPMDLNAAFRRAEAQLVQEFHSGSEDSSDRSRAFDSATHRLDGAIATDGSPSPAARTYRRDSYIKAPFSRPDSRRDSDLGSHLRKFDRDHQLTAGSGPLNGLFTNKNRVGPKVSETGHALAKKASDGSLGGSPESRRPRQRRPSTQDKENVSVSASTKESAVEAGSTDLPAKDAPIPSIEPEMANDDDQYPMTSLARASPEKSMNWHLDADFTAGDLQISDSPRVGLGRANRRSPSVTSELSSVPGITINRQSNNRLDEIRRREAEAAKTAIPESEVSVPKRTTSRLDEIRMREIQALSRRAVASSRLDEIRIKNSEARSQSPEFRRLSNKDDLNDGSAGQNDWPTKISKTNSDPELPELKRELPADTPVIITKESQHNDKVSDDNPQDGAGDNGAEGAEKRRPLPKNDSHELLRQLARATSSSPPAEKISKTEKATEPSAAEGLSSKNTAQERNSSRPRLAREEGRSKHLEVRSSRERPTVGFAGLRRVLSTDATLEKRQSLPTSEVDPTDRIEAEMKLFDPLDNYSEKGSMRAPSPDSSEPMEEATPRPRKLDPLTQPTPQVTGAYVETPATARHEPSNQGMKKEDLPSRPQDAPEALPEAGTRNDSKPPKGEVAPAAKARIMAVERPISRSSSVPAVPRRRAGSASRHRRPLINTANPPRVRDDIRSIMRANEIDDSTLENMDSILASEDIDDKELEQMVTDTYVKVESELDREKPRITTPQRELETYDRMSKTLRTGLLGIRSAKKGIERLEDKVNHTDHQGTQVFPNLKTTDSPAATSISVMHGAQVQPVLMVQVPALYHTRPKFRLTRLGLMTIVFSIWYALESVFCYHYASPPYACTLAAPCDWSPNEPYFPYTMPFMLDEWATDGKGRALLWRLGEEIGDMTAEVSDWITNTDFTQHDELYMDVWERKRHRRRLKKHGLGLKWTPPPGYKLRYPEWHAAQIARQEAEELGLVVEDETMSSDERVS